MGFRRFMREEIEKADRRYNGKSAQKDPVQTLCCRILSDFGSRVSQRSLSGILGPYRNIQRK